MSLARRLVIATVVTVASATVPALTATSGASAAAPAGAPSGWTARPATYGVNVTDDVPVTMSDGTVLRVNVYRPANADGTAVAKRFPVILTQTPYNKSTPQLGFRDDYLVERGYVQVVADVRGTGSSEGTWDSFGSREQKDGAELVNWAHSSARPWSNGDVGLWGVSYAAINQFFTAAQHPAGLKAMFPIVPAGDVYRDVAASGGQIDSGFIPFWLGLVTATGIIPPAYTTVDPASGVGTLLQHAGGVFAFQGPTMADAVTGGDKSYDGSFYKLRSPLSVVDKVKVPTFVTGGEYDLFQRGEPMLYQHLRANGVPSRLLIGPWTHLQASSAPGLPTGTLPSLDALSLRWFDKYLRGASDKALDTDVKPVNYYEIGSGQWRTAPGWLPSDVHARAYRLSGTATPGTPGQLTTGTATTGADDVYPVPVAGLCTRSASQWTAGLAAIPGCETDNRVNDQTGTSYETPALTKAVHVMGPINARLYASTTAKDGMLSVHVEDVAPDGTVDRLTGGWQVLSHRATDSSKVVKRDGEVLQTYHPFTKAAQLPVTSGQVMGIDVEVFPTGAALLPGHRLRITVQAFDTPHLTAPLPQLPDQATGIITIHHSAAYPSRLVLPVRD
jgi:putative CocE/NonD family hydrolase